MAAPTGAKFVAKVQLITYTTELYAPTAPPNCATKVQFVTVANASYMTKDPCSEARLLNRQLRNCTPAKG